MRDTMNIEIRLRNDAPAWREHVATRHGAVECAEPRRWGWRIAAPIAAAAALAVVAFVSMRWEEQSQTLPVQTVEIEDPYAVFVSSMRKIPAPTVIDMPAIAPAALASRFDNPYATEAERLTTEVRTAIDFVLDVFPADLIAEGEAADPMAPSSKRPPTSVPEAWLS